MITADKSGAIISAIALIFGLIAIVLIVRPRGVAGILETSRA